MSEYMEKHAVSRLMARLLDTLDTKKAASLPSRSGAALTALCCSMRSKRRTLTCSTFYCRSWTMAGLPTAKAGPVDFKNTVIIMTSNIGSSFLQAEGLRSEQEFNEASQQVMNALHGHFKPDVPECVDDIIVFRRWAGTTGRRSSSCAWRICGSAGRAQDSLEAYRHGKELLFTEGFDPNFGRVR